MKDKCLVCGEGVDVKTGLVSLNYTKEERDAIFKALVLEKTKEKETSDKLLKKKRVSDDGIQRLSNKKQKI
jgi:hypothetical protein